MAYKMYLNYIHVCFEYCHTNHKETVFTEQNHFLERGKAFPK